MTARELLTKQIDEVSYQLEKSLEGVTETDADFKIAPTAMSLREMVEHLCECYVAVEEESRGVNHEWGSYSIEDKSLGNLMSQFNSLRSKAVEIVTSSDDDKLITSGSGFIVGHDNYHVGQICSTRLAINPEWDAYCIYRF